MKIETFEAVARLTDQLVNAGVPRAEAGVTSSEYLHALLIGSDGAWRTFYHSVYRRLDELARREYPFVGRKALPLLALLDDNLGATLISEGERARIRHLLVEYERREASLSS